MMIGSATEPKMAAKIGKFQNHSGRRVLTSAPSGQEKSTQPKEDSARNRNKFGANASIEEIDRLLEADAIALVNIKKEIGQSQQAELDKLQLAVMTAKKEYDVFLTNNNLKERECQSLLDKYTALVNVDRADNTVVLQARNFMDQLKEQTAKVLENLAAEQRTIRMQTLMIKRLESEIGRCRVEMSKAQTALEIARHDVALADSALQANRQDLLDQELACERLQNTLKARKEQREGKISMLNSMSMEGESSVIKLQASLQETARRTAAIKSRKASTRGKAGGTKGNHAEGLEEDLNDDDELRVLAKRMTVNQLRDAIVRFQSQSQRIEKLQQQDVELRANLTLQQKKKSELSDHLTQTQFKIQQLASSRQIYQEVDLKDSALAATSKACEEAKEREHRLRLSLEEVKQSVPRFLTKITKVVHPKPSDNQLGDAIIKLEDEIIKLIKVINMALLKDASADDLAMMAQAPGGAQVPAGQPSGTAEANSEFGRLQRLPGFSRMQRQLFFNLMTARPDVSEQNIRIERASVKPPRKAPENSNAAVSPRARKLITQLSAGSLNSNEEEELEGMVGFSEIEDMSLDRDTVKNISRLIYERDHKPVKPGSRSKAR